MSVHSYLARLEDTLRSRKDIDLKDLQVKIRAVSATFAATAHFHNKTQLTIVEYIAIADRREFKRVAYKFHYQQADSSLIFRYDNSPHTPISRPFHIINMTVIWSPKRSRRTSLTSYARLML